jgi:crotonobetainyl-CoA:carnitine CoA-transferase CaiB-like acyl-CoA transferase
MVDAAPKFSTTAGRAGDLTTIGADTEALLAELGYDDLSELRSNATIA